MIRIRAMTRDDLPLGLRLSREAGWNQNRADWARALDLQPDGCVVAESDSAPVATLATCLFGTVAWVAMVLVDRAHRGRGIGRALMEHALDVLDGRGVRTIRLDATHLGRPLYERLGFVGEYPLVRFGGTPAVADGPSPSRPFDSSMMGRIGELDRSAAGTDRGRLLLRLAEEYPDAVRVAGPGGEVDGYVMGRPGSLAFQVGPCVASPEAGRLLLADALARRRNQPVFVDIPAEHAEAAALVLSLGLESRRRFLRMRRGEAVVEEPQSLWASSGPEMG